MSKLATISLGLAVALLTSGTAFAGNFIQVPEPGTLGILAAGAAGLAIYRHWRRRK